MSKQTYELTSQSNILNSTSHPEDQNQPEKSQENVSFIQLFRFADNTDRLLMFFGTLGAVLIGTAMPLFAFLWGNMTTTFGQGDEAIVTASKTVMFEFFGIGGGAFVAAWVMYACWMIAGQRQAIKCRKQYLKSLLAQEIGWFDQVNQSQIATKFSSDCFSFQGAIGEKVSLMIQTFAMFLAGFVIAFVKGWKMALVTLAAIPALAIAGAIYVTAIQTKDKRNAKYYAKAGGLAEQAFSSIKTIKQMNGEKFQIQAYKKCLESGSKKGLKFGFFAALALGIMSFSLLAAHALGFWYGSNCVEANFRCTGDRYEPGDVLIIFFSVLMAALNLSQLSPSIKKIAEGKAAASRIFQVLDREPLVKNPQNSKIPKNFVGHIKFEDVTFAYPKNKKVNILNNVCLEFNAHNTALVGQSGCGKSTILQLLMRFYDPDQGEVYLDGINLKELDLGWLRSKIGYVGQEPVLFAMSIKQNLLFGRENATDEQINQALRQAEAYDFVQMLDDGINTFVGSGGGQLSGGQKQRIAIARALLRDPKILLLDEATSALDRKNEKLIQKTLDKISTTRTTISIAHRTRTIMNADIIYVLNKGGIEESGKFKDLKRYKDYEVEKQIDELVQVKKDQTAKLGIIDFVDPSLPAKEQQSAVKTKEELAGQQKMRLMEIYDEGIYKRLFRYSEGSQCLLIVGLCFSLAAGLVYPTFTIFFAKMLKTLFDFKDNPVQAREDANYYALIFTYISIIGFFVNFVNSSIFSIVGDKITKRVRIQAFSKIVKMPIPWFDLPRNNGGQLTTKLSSDSLMVNGLTATFMSILIQNIATLTAGIVVALVFEWRTALFSMGMLPLMIIVGMISQNRKSGFSDKTDEIYKESSNLIVECMSNIRTVESFGYEDIVLRKYDQKLEEPMKIGIKKGNVSGLLFAVSQLIMFFVFGLIFFLGTVFKRDNNLGIDNVFTAIYAIFFSAMTVGNNSHFMPDIEEGKLAAARLFEVIDGEDEDQLQVKENSKMIKTPIEGHIVIENLNFKYDSRHTNVFNGFNLQIKKGNKVAFVGASGCGKSTILQLIQRFYFSSEGRILIDGVDIQDYDIHHLRASLGVVSQEPTLFNGSFKYNIQYNIPDVQREEIVEVARSANAFSFIMGEQKLEQVKSVKKEEKSDQQINEEEKKEQNKTGFDRNVGLKGSQISGGQKQRVAIARTLLRRPKVLLLDEATSALDSKNEEIVQKALDQIMEGRTTISVAHRIDTIKNSDEINVFQRGAIVEKGKYAELVKKKGYFFNLERGTQFL